jgi:hypothetical protein
MEAWKKRGRILLRGMWKRGIFKGLYVVMLVTTVISGLAACALVGFTGMVPVWSDSPSPSDLPLQPDPLFVVLVIGLPVVSGGLAWLFHKLDEVYYWPLI